VGEFKQVMNGGKKFLHQKIFLPIFEVSNFFHWRKHEFKMNSPIPRTSQIYPMSLTLDLDQNIENQLFLQAKNQGLDVDEYILQIIHQRIANAPSSSKLPVLSELEFKST
jgi:hypothetical protein